LANDVNLRSEVAIIIPCYNAAPYLARAIESIFAQTYRDHCIYVIDDGSTDGTEAVLQSYAGRIVSLRQEHCGQSSARNHGIRVSESPYIAFLDADDEWLAEKLERQITLLRQAPRTGMIYSDCLTSGSGPAAGSYFARIGIPSGGRVFQRFLKTCEVYTPTVVVRRECLLDVGGFDETLPVGEDYNLWLRIAAGWDVEVIPEALAIRHVTPGSLSRTTSREQVASNVITVLEKVQEACPGLAPHERQALQVAMGWRHYAYGSYLLARGDRRQSRVQFLNSWRHGVHNWRPIAGLGLGLLPHQTSMMLKNIYKGLRSSRAQASPTTNRDAADPNATPR
jgi:glycosyltransferase involved in cell wall biosynthesis